MVAGVNDRWEAPFTVDRLGRYEYALSAWVDAFASWRAALLQKVAAEQEGGNELLTGADLVRGAAGPPTGPEAARWRARARPAAPRGRCGRGEGGGVGGGGGGVGGGAMARPPARSLAPDSTAVLAVSVEPERAACGAWYEMFPRSASPVAGRHGTFADVEARLPYIADMGFEVLYLPPIHPIGRTHRKGPNNTPGAQRGDPGSPWAIGSSEGGPTAAPPERGAVDALRRLVAAARRHRLDVALDLAFQCSPDHPYVAEHPQWFAWRPDGTVQYAENPPKKY